LAIGDALAAGAALGTGEVAALVFAGAVTGAQRTRVAMQTPMINELFVFMFLLVGVVAGDAA
jgi:hypothetical protein